MKTAAWIVAALLAGLVLGGWGLKADLRKARTEISDLKKELSRTSRKQSRMDGITTMLNLPQGQDRPADTAKGEVTVGFHGERRTNAPGWEHRQRPHWEGRADRGTNAAPRPMREQIDTAVKAWKVRSDIARAGFIAEATSNEEQVIKFDVLMEAMNLRLSNSIRTWVDAVKIEETMTPESGVRMMNDLSGVIVQAYADMDRELPDWRVATEETFNAMDFVDPQVALPLTEIEDIMRTQRWDNAEFSTNAPGSL